MHPHFHRHYRKYITVAVILLMAALMVVYSLTNDDSMRSRIDPNGPATMPATQTMPAAP